MDRALKLPRGQLATLADVQRKEELKRELGEESPPLLGEVRALILRKCRPDKQREIRTVFQRAPFGELERLVTQKLLDVVKRVARDELDNERWLRTVARLSGRTFAETRVTILEFLDTDVFHVSQQQCDAFLDPLIASWDIDLATFGLEIVMNHRVTDEHVRRFEFVEREPGQPTEEPGFRAFLRDATLSGTVNAEEREFLRKLGCKNKRPTALFYYRQL